MHKLGLTVALLCALLIGCNARTGSKTAAAGTPSATTASAHGSVSSEKTTSAQLVGYNHTDHSVAAFYVNGAWGGHLSSGEGGGGFVCCVDLPFLWHEGYAVSVEWEDHEGKTQKRQVLVPKYDAKTMAAVGVHFLRDGQIKVFASPVFLGHPDYPIKGEEAKMPPSLFDRRSASILSQ